MVLKCTKNQSGQMVVEAVLLMVVFIALFNVFAEIMRQNEIVQTIVTVPYQKVRSMATNGNWIPEQDESRYNHPMHLKRHITFRGDAIQ